MRLRVIFSYLILFFFLIGALLISNRAQAKLFTSEIGKFSANFPSNPIEEHADKKTFVGTIKETWFTAKTGKGEFIVGYTHLPELLIFFGGHHKILRKAKDIFLEKEGAQEVSFTDTEVEGYRSNKLVFKTNSGEPGKALFIFDKKRVYMVMAKSTQGDTVIDKFLASFRIFPDR